MAKSNLRNLSGKPQKKRTICSRTDTKTLAVFLTVTDLLWFGLCVMSGTFKLESVKTSTSRTSTRSSATIQSCQSVSTII